MKEKKNGTNTLIENRINDSYKEKCVLCGSKTDESINTHIDYRSFYIEGIGQLCKECFESTYD